MQNLIFGAFAALEGYREGDAANLGRAVYDRCTVVALCSAKLANPACTVALVTNAPPQEPYRSQLTNAGIEIWDCPFTSYRVPADTNWALALREMGWQIRTLPTPPSPGYLPQSRMICDTANWVPHAASQGMTAALTHFGGEFVAGSTARLQDFMAECRNVFDRMQQTGVRSQDGDEAILDAAAYRSQLAGKPVRAANAYVFRYWLGGHFYYVSTNYCCDPVCVLHLPGKAKMRQLTVLYHKYTRSGRMPKNQTVWRLCCLPAARPPLLRSLWVRLRAKIGI